MSHIAPAAAILLAAATAAVTAGEALAGDVDLPRHPSLSPDGSRVVFSWRGDLWSASSHGGPAVRLTAHPAEETRSAWSPDGRTIAFQSDRSGYENVHLMDADGGSLRQVTFEDHGMELDGFTPDGTMLTLTAFREGDVHREPRPYKVAVAGGPLHRVLDAFGRGASLSPDGATWLFSRGGSAPTRRGYRGSDSRDVWLLEGTTFRRLTEWGGNDFRPSWAGAGTVLHLSDRTDGVVSVWLRDVARDDRSAQRVASFAPLDVWDLAVSRDGGTAIAVVWDALWRIDLAGGAAPEKLSFSAPDDAWDDDAESVDAADKVTEAALSPDGKAMAFVACGEVFVRSVEDRQPTQRVTSSPSRERHVAWSPDGVTLFFVSDEPGRDEIRAARVATTRSEVRDAFAKATNPQPTPPAPEPPKAAEPKPDDETKDDAKDDGKPEEKKDAKTKSAKGPADRWQDALSFTVETVVAGEFPSRHPRPSPDGKRLAYRRGLGDVVVRDLASGAETVLVRGFDSGIDFRWSPDSAWIAYHQDDRNFNTDVWIVASDGAAPAVNVSRHPSDDTSPRWSADGKVLAFLSKRSAREVDVWRVHLDRSLDAMSPAETAEYLKDAAAAAKKRKPLAVPKAGAPAAKTPVKDAVKDAVKDPWRPDLDDAWKRLVRVTTLRGDESSLEVSPGGDLFVFRGKNGEEEGIFAVGHDGKGLKKLGAAGDVQGFSLSGEQVIVVAGGKATMTPAAGGAPKTIDVEAKLRFDRAEQSARRLRDAAAVVGEHFYHPTMKGLDWPALSARYAALAAKARTAEEFDFVANALLGELNASHLGIRMRRRNAPQGEPNGRIGVDVSPGPGSFVVRRVVPYGPADRSVTRLREGDSIVAIDGRDVTPTRSFDAHFAGRVGRETRVTIEREQGGAGPRLRLEALVVPVSSSADGGLRYDAWTAANAARVSELSGGRLGYLHVRGMNQPSLEDFERDLYAAGEGKDGLVLDVRDNGGGWTADLLLASLTVQPHAYAVPRGGDGSDRTAYPQDRLWIQRYVKPANLLCNQKSFSNAEILSHAFRTLRRGTLVGVPTYGGVISTGDTQLVDGTNVRIPFRGWYLPDGTDMENHGAVPDLLVPQTPDAEARGEDVQLAAAVADLLRRIPPK